MQSRVEVGESGSQLALGGSGLTSSFPGIRQRRVEFDSGGEAIYSGNTKEVQQKYSTTCQYSI